MRSALEWALWTILTVGTMRGLLLVAAVHCLSRLSGNLRTGEALAAWLTLLVGLLFLPAAWLLVPRIPFGTPSAPVGALLTRVLSTPLVPPSLSPGPRAMIGPQGPLPPLLTRLWLPGALAFALRAVLRAFARRRPGPGEMGPPPAGVHLSRLRGLLGVRRPVALRLSPRSRTPRVVGLLRPAVVLPRGSRGWTEDALCAVLAHELAHLRRHDALWSGLADAVACALWFLPPVWLARRAIAREADAGCDRLAARLFRARLAYSEGLAEAGRSWEQRSLLPPSLSDRDRRDLSRRVEAILREATSPRGPRRLPALPLATVALCLLAAPMPRLEARLEGWWVNDDAEAPYRRFLDEGGSGAAYQGHAAGESPLGAFRYVTTGAWTDLGGNTWYTLDWRWGAWPFDDRTAVRWRLVVRIDPTGRHRVETSVVGGPDPRDLVTAWEWRFTRSSPDPALLGKSARSPPPLRPVAPGASGSSRSSPAKPRTGSAVWASAPA